MPFNPLRWLRGLILFGLALFAAWSAARHFRGKAEAHRRRRAATYTDDAVRAHDRARRAEQSAEQAKKKAKERIQKLRERGHTSMAQAVESLNALD